MSDRLTLTPEQLKEITDGKVRPHAQVKRLRALGVPFLWDGKGPVKVPISWLENHPARKEAPRPGFAPEPDFEKYEKA